jgi:DNA-directed RNA polymerase subunit H (RpoH/RPB5)
MPPRKPPPAKAVGPAPAQGKKRPALSNATVSDSDDDAADEKGRAPVAPSAARRPPAPSSRGPKARQHQGQANGASGSDSSASSDADSSSDESAGAGDSDRDAEDGRGANDAKRSGKKSRPKAGAQEEGGDKKKKAPRVSAATLKRRMSPGLLQNRVARKTIWFNLQRMLQVRGYRWVADRAEPGENDELLPNNKGYLGLFHLHAVDAIAPPDAAPPAASPAATAGAGGSPPEAGGGPADRVPAPGAHAVGATLGAAGASGASGAAGAPGVIAAAAARRREPVFVVFCSNAGGPTLNSLKYPSRHVIVVSDILTGRATAALGALLARRPPAALDQQGVADPRAHASVTSASVGNATLEGDGVPAYAFREVHMEAFVSSAFMFDLLDQHYLRGVQFSVPSAAELERVFEAYEPGRHVDRFPRILDSDPVIRYLGLPAGTIVKQNCLSSSAAIHPSYRLVSSSKV